MSLRAKWFTMLAFAMGLVSPIVTIGCAEHHYRVYDPYYHDYHRWNAGEESYYRQWATENHREPNRDFRQLDKDDQQRYWQWRHNHESGVNRTTAATTSMITAITKLHRRRVPSAASPSS
jgi:hypothetical protein